MSSQEFRDLVRIFTASDDVNRHHESIIAILDPLDLDIEYKKLVREDGLQRVRDIFSSFADTSEEEMLSEYEKKRLEQVGVLTEQYFEQKAYQSFALMIYQLLLESFFERYDFNGDLGAIPSEVIYQTLPEEIQLQTFLLESMSNNQVFNWNRREEIIVQSLLVLTICFSDVYSFLTEDEEEEQEFGDL